MSTQAGQSVGKRLGEQNNQQQKTKDRNARLPEDMECCVANHGAYLPQEVTIETPCSISIPKRLPKNMLPLHLDYCYVKGGGVTHGPALGDSIVVNA